MRLLRWRRGRYFQKGKRCDAGKNRAVNASHEVIKQLLARDQSDARTRAHSQSLRERKSASCIHFAQGALECDASSHRFVLYLTTTRSDVWRRSRSVGGKQRTNEAPICRCNDQMAWCPGAALQ